MARFLFDTKYNTIHFSIVFFHEIRRDLKQRCRPLQELLDLPDEGPGVKVGEIYKRLGFGFL